MSRRNVPVVRTRTRRAELAALTALLLLAVPAAGAPATAVAAPPGSGATAVAYRAPVDGPVVVARGFDDVGRYDAGHRGVDLRVTPPGAVRAAAAGTVTFAGQVAGRGVVTVLHADGVRTSYEPVAAAVATGAVVASGAELGTVAGAHGGFPAGSVLHWGARRGEVYLDPMSLLAPLGAVRLLPWTDP